MNFMIGGGAYEGYGACVDSRAEHNFSAKRSTRCRMENMHAAAFQLPDLVSAARYGRPMLLSLLECIGGLHADR